MPDTPRPAPALVRRLAGPGTALALAAGAAAYVAAVDPNEPGHYPGCPVLALTGRYCPGCGGLRSVHALTHGDLAGAAGANALALAAVAATLFVLTAWALAAARDRELTLPVRTAHGWAAGALMVAFTVVRNLPFGHVLAP
ncbi:hypothetical protein SRB5_60330 [Streptomyces sp. RB5]|uniref:DUF2752 domain-containing protein n=1 Tax=Streptomyces smaragdinus TaxID=2585196 RepID=A0A7K0CS64_9ACTN|nr:DUF2752 domain-containing protein [Streptomyces smaragdinus]MQY15842.1 hypothetical protein [Streptomyces smaragdinus]